MANTQPENKNEKGQSLVEFAVSAVLLLLLVGGIVDFGRAFFTYVAMRDAAQEAAIYGSICPKNAAGIENRARTSSTWPISFVGNPDIDVFCTYTESNSACSAVATPTVGSGIQIVVAYPNFPLTTPILTSILGGDTISMRATISDTILRNTMCAN